MNIQYLIKCLNQIPLFSSADRQVMLEAFFSFELV